MAQIPDQKQAILNRVRKALSQPTDNHVRHQSQPSTASLPIVQPTTKDASNFLPPVGQHLDDQIRVFAELSDRLKTDFRVVESFDIASDVVSDLAEKNHWKKIGFHQNELVETVTSQLSLEKLSTDSPYRKQELEQCDAGISACEALIAQTASVLISTRSSGGRALSVLPPHHVVIATAEQMLATMVDGYQLLYQRYGQGNDWPSFISYITGPSRTADVERVLVLGAHGPKKLTVILVK